MHVVTNHEDIELPFRVILCGQTFTWQGDLYIKTDAGTIGIRLKDGKTQFFHDNDKVREQVDYVVKKEVKC